MMEPGNIEGRGDVVDSMKLKSLEEEQQEQEAQPQQPTQPQQPGQNVGESLGSWFKKTFRIGQKQQA